MSILRRLKRNIKYTWQIWTRGWCDCETWDLELSFAENILPRLKRFREIGTHSYPNGLTPEEWDRSLDAMIFAFEQIVADEISVKNLALVNAGIALFTKYYLSLWD